MNCIAIADEEGMVTELETVNNSLQKMISTLTQLSREFPCSHDISSSK